MFGYRHCSRNSFKHAKAVVVSRSGPTRPPKRSDSVTPGGRASPHGFQGPTTGRPLGTCLGTITLRFVGSKSKDERKAISVSSSRSDNTMPGTKADEIESI